MLKAENLSFGFAHLPLFSDVSVAVKHGDLLHLTGPNGVGKSTLVQIIAGILEPIAGRLVVTLNEKPVVDRRLACEYLPSEGNGLFLRRDAMANLMFWPPLRGKTIARPAAEQELIVWGLTKKYFREDFPVAKFSTGMKRRLALARVSLSGAPIWLLDEPIYGLDHHAIELFRQKLGNHLKSGGAAIVISHDLTLFENLTPRQFSLSPVVKRQEVRS